MSHPIVLVSRKTKAALMNHVLRAYTLVAANEPVYAAENYDYMYDHDAARFVLLHDKNSNFMSAVQKQFEDLNKAMTYKYTWDGTKLEKDHAMEVQHVIKMLVDTGYLDDVRWAHATLTSVLHLGYYLNDRRNLWSIPAGLNRLKKTIPLRNWYQQGAWMVGKVNYLEAFIAQKNFVKEYLFAYATEDGRTPFTELLDLSAEMSGLPETELTWLTRAAGMEIFNLLTGWCDSLGIDKQFSVRAQKVSNPEESIADLYSHERESLRAKRSFLKLQAAKGERLFVSDADKVRYTYDFDTGTKHYSHNYLSADGSFSAFVDQVASQEEDADAFDDDRW